MNFKAYDLVYYHGALKEAISNPTPDKTIMIRTKDDPTTMIEVKISDIRKPLDYLFQTVGDYTPAGLGKLIERIGMDHDAPTALLVIDHCLRQDLNLSHCWANIRHYIHDVLRKGNPEWAREDVYTATIQQLCDSVALFAEVYYDDNDDKELSRRKDRGHLLGSNSQDLDVHGDLREEGRIQEDDELSQGCDGSSSGR